MGCQITCKKECDDVKHERPLLFSIFNTSNEMCSRFECALTFAIYKRGLAESNQVKAKSGNWTHWSRLRDLFSKCKTNLKPQFTARDTFYWYTGWTNSVDWVLLELITVILWFKEKKVLLESNQYKQVCITWHNDKENLCHRLCMERQCICKHC